MKLHSTKCNKHAYMLYRFCNLPIFHLRSLFTPSILQVLTTVYFTYLCNSTARDVFLGILYGYKMVLQIVALVLALPTHKVKVKGLNDAKYIAAAIYATSIEVAGCIYTLSGFVNGFVAVMDLLGKTFTLGVVYVPKVNEWPRE